MVHHYWAITVKYNVGNSVVEVAEGHYQIWMDNAKKLGLVIYDFTFEYDAQWRLHMHAVGDTRKMIFKKRLLLPGYHQQINELSTHADAIIWMKYMYKMYDYESQKAIFAVLAENNMLYNDRTRDKEHSDAMPSCPKEGGEGREE